MKKSETKKELTSFEDFSKYVNKLYGKKPGEYTDSELEEIGSKFKTVYNGKSKRWDKLVEFLGVNKTGECFRNWIKNRQYANGTIVKNQHMLSGKTIEELTFPDFENKVEEEKRELYKQEVRTRDIYNCYRRDLSYEARWDRFLNVLSEAAANKKPLPNIKKPVIQKTQYQNEAIMDFSDLHLGMTCDEFYNKYNIDIARKRVQKYVNDTIAICKKNKIYRLNIINGGDIVAGDIHETGRIIQEVNLAQQVTLAEEMLADAINQLTAAAPEVIYRSCVGNHDRMMPDFRRSLAGENFCILIDHYLETRLADSGVKFVHDNLDVDLGKFTLLNGKKVMFSHGDHDSYNEVIQDYLGATHEYIDYIFLHHFHAAKMKAFQGVKVIINGSICGTDHYAAEKRLYGPAEQVLVIFDNQNHNVDINYINVDIRE